MCVRCTAQPAQKTGNKKGGAMKFKSMCAKCLKETKEERRAAGFSPHNMPATTGPIRRHLERIPQMLDRIEAGTAPEDFPKLIFERLARARMRVADLSESVFHDVKVEFNAKLDVLVERANKLCPV